MNDSNDCPLRVHPGGDSRVIASGNRLFLRFSHYGLRREFAPEPEARMSRNAYAARDLSRNPAEAARRDRPRCGSIGRTPSLSLDGGSAARRAMRFVVGTVSKEAVGGARPRARLRADPSASRTKVAGARLCD